VRAFALSCASAVWFYPGLLRLAKTFVLVDLGFDFGTGLRFPPTAHAQVIEARILSCWVFGGFTQSLVSLRGWKSKMGPLRPRFSSPF